MSVVTRKYQEEIFGVTDDQFHILTDAYTVSDKSLKESVALLKDWYSKQNHLPQIQLDDHDIAVILGINKFSVETTKFKLDNLYTVRTVFPEIYSNRDPWDPVISKALDTIDWYFMPKLTPEKYRIQIMRPGGKDPDAYDLDNAFIASSMIADIKMSLDISCGEVYVWDFVHVRMNHVVKVTPAYIKKGLFIMQNCYGARIQEIHILNLPKYAEPAINLFKTFLKKKIADRIHFHASLEDLHKMIPKEYLPKDYGGDIQKTGDEMSEAVRKVVKSPEWRDWFLQSMKIKTDESKRIKESETWIDDLIGMRGTFRKLDID